MSDLQELGINPPSLVFIQDAQLTKDYEEEVRKTEHLEIQALMVRQAAGQRKKRMMSPSIAACLSMLVEGILTVHTFTKS